MNAHTNAPEQPPFRTPALVGRTRELATLQSLLSAALEGHGRLALIGGDAGIGKTALAEALCAAASEHGALVLTGRCYDRTETPPYGPFLDLLLGYDPTGDLPPAPFSPWHGPGAVQSQAALYEQVCAFFQNVATRCPLIVLLDDLHWADDASLDLLRVIARAIPSWPILLLVTYRADELHRRHPFAMLLPLLERDGPVTHLILRPLTDEDILTLIQTRYMLRSTDAARLVNDLRTRSEGNPLFVVQLLHALEEEEILRHDGTDWTLDDVSRLGVPLPLSRVIEARLARLDTSQRALLDVASLIGQEVPLRLWSSVAEQQDAAIEDAVEAASTLGVLQASADGARARFVHALVREAVHAGVFPPRRRALHRKIAEVLSTVPAVDPNAPSYHFAQAGDPRAIPWLLQAADRAERLFAFRTATEHLSAALDMLHEHGVETAEGEEGWIHLHRAWLYRYGGLQQGLAALDDAERVALKVGDRALAAQSTFQRGHLWCRQGHLRQGLVALERGVAALEVLEPGEWEHGQTLARASGASWTPPGVQEARGTLALFLAVAGRYAEAQSVIDTLHQSPTPRPAMTDVTVEQALGIVHSALGRPTEARLAYARARASYHATGNHLLAASMCMQELSYVVVPYQADAVAERQALAERASEALVRARGTSTLADLPTALPGLSILVLEGRWREAHELAMTPQPGGPWRGLCRGALAAVTSGQGDVHHAWETVHEALPEGPATEPGNDDCRESLTLQRLAVALALTEEDLAIARDWLSAHDRWLAWSGAVLGRADGMLGWAAYYHTMGDLTAARRHAEAALAHANEPLQPLVLLAAQRMLGQIATTAGQFDDAERYLVDALQRADTCAAPYERAQTLLALADQRRATGNHESLRQLAQEALDIGTDLAAEPVVARAAALLNVSPITRDSDASYPAGLSAREVEVLRHLAAGSTNREIAAALYLSEHTVRAHVRNIFTKTGADNRAAAAVFALRHGLA